MTLSIELSRPPAIPYSFGETICGIVKLHAKKEEEFQTISIFFQGHTIFVGRSSQIDATNNPRDRRSSACLFRQHIILRQGGSPLQPGKHSWPFSFKIPSHAQYCDTVQGQHEFGWFDSQSPFLGSADAESHILPSTFEYWGKNQCSVKYTIEARLIRTASYLLLGEQNLTHARRIILRQAGAAATTSFYDTAAASSESQTINIGSYAEGHDLGDNLKKAWNRLKGCAINTHFKQTIPESQINIAVELPRVLILSDTAPVHILVNATQDTLEESTNHPSECTNGDLQIKSFSIDLIQHTKARLDNCTSTDIRSLTLAQGSCIVPVTRRVLFQGSLSPEHPTITTYNDDAMKQAQLYSPDVVRSSSIAASTSTASSPASLYSTSTDAVSGRDSDLAGRRYWNQSASQDPRTLIEVSRLDRPGVHDIQYFPSLQYADQTYCRAQRQDTQIREGRNWHSTRRAVPPINASVQPSPIG